MRPLARLRLERLAVKYGASYVDVSIYIPGRVDRTLKLVFRQVLLSKYPVFYKPKSNSLCNLL